MLTKTEKDILANVLEQAIDMLSNQGCNDEPVLCTEENMTELTDFIHEYAVDEDQAQHLLKSAVPGKQVYFQDWLLLSHFKHKFLDNSSE